MLRRSSAAPIGPAFPQPRPRPTPLAAPSSATLNRTFHAGHVRKAGFPESEPEPPAETTFSKGDGRSVVWVFLYRITNLSDTRRPSWACLEKFTSAGWWLL